MLRQRYIPPDIREDVKIGKIVPMDTFLVSTVLFIAALMLQVFLALAQVEISFLGRLALFSISFITLVSGTLKIPERIYKHADFIVQSKKAKTLQSLFDDGKTTEPKGFFKILEEIGFSMKMSGSTTRNKKTNEYKAYYEITADPWEIAPESDKDRRADSFAQQCVSLLNNNCSITILGVCKPESTAQLELRTAKSENLPPGLKRLEKERIEHHYKISRAATSTEYYAKITAPSEEELPGTFLGGIQLGSDFIEELAFHLTPGAKLKRGRENVEQFDN